MTRADCAIILTIIIALAVLATSGTPSNCSQGYAPQWREKCEAGR